MWKILGKPRFSIAVPCSVAANKIADPLADEHGSELGEIAFSRRVEVVAFESTHAMSPVRQELPIRRIAK